MVRVGVGWGCVHSLQINVVGKGILSEEYRQISVCVMQHSFQVYFILIWF